MSVLLDELKQGSEAYISVSETLELLSKATKNSPIADVKTYLLANNIYKFMPIFFRDECFRYNIDEYEESYVNSTGEFSSTYRALTGELVGNEYFSVEELNEFEFVRKHDIFAYKRGYHYIAEQQIDNFNRGDYVTGFSNKNFNMLLKKRAVKKVLIEQPTQTMSTPIMRSESKTSEHLALEAENEKLNKRLHKAVDVYKEQKNQISKLKEQLEKLATNKELLQEKIDDLEKQFKKINTKLASLPTDTNKKEGQGDSLLILGAVMHCIQDAAKKNYTQELLIQVILDKYKNVSGISEGTLKKKFPEAKKHLNQLITS